MASDLDHARKLLGPKRVNEGTDEYETRVTLISAALRRERQTGERTGMINAIALLRNRLDGRDEQRTAT